MTPIFFFAIFFEERWCHLPKPHSPKIPSILYFDLETSPNIGAAWNRYQQDLIEIIQHRKIISIAWMWEHEGKVRSRAIPDYYKYKDGIKNNKKLIQFIHSLLSAADILVGQNIDDFDIKMANTEFLQHGLVPMKPHSTVDTLKLARGRFRFNSNKLDDIAKYLGLGKKLEHEGYKLWRGCMDGEPWAWKRMKAYNEHDVVLTAKVYNKFRGWTRNHPNMTAFDAIPACTACRSIKVKRNGWRITKKGRKQMYTCQTCGHWMYGKAVETTGVEWA